jgi:hypothetical protein
LSKHFLPSHGPGNFAGFAAPKPVADRSSKQIDHFDSNDSTDCAEVDKAGAALSSISWGQIKHAEASTGKYYKQ